MRMGLAVTRFDWPGSPGSICPTFGRIARSVEGAGFGSLWVMDHFFQIPLFGPPEQEMLEGYSALTFAAGKTERIELGTLVTGVTHRHPGVLVKTATTLDVLSGGRAWFGIGAAGYEEDHAGLGIPLPTTAERFERLEETLRIARQMWVGGGEPFEGEHYRLGRPLNPPNSVKRPHPPILVGGGGEKKTLRLVAKYADACNLFDAFGVGFVRDKLSVLRGRGPRVRGGGEDHLRPARPLAQRRGRHGDPGTGGGALPRAGRRGRGPRYRNPGGCPRGEGVRPGCKGGDPHRNLRAPLPARVQQTKAVTRRPGPLRTSWLEQLHISGLGPRASGRMDRRCERKREKKRWA